MTAPTTPLTRLPTGTWDADLVHSTIGFSVRHMAVATFRSRFESYRATLSVSEDGRGALTGAVDAASIVVRDPDLQAHLASEEFFDVERHPQLRFESSEIRRDGDVIEVDGLLTIKGRTLPVTGRGTVTDPHVDADGDTRIGLELETTVDRRQFGLEWNAPLPRGGWALADEVRLSIDLSMRAA